ncbi:MAG TPA: hypothetical protein VHV49_17095 [Pseudonocardiaceae bacterium]|nr:hypothetical protein [Pseudonocardiaceae bacterium]
MSRIALGMEGVRESSVKGSLVVARLSEGDPAAITAAVRAAWELQAE